MSVGFLFTFALMFPEIIQWTTNHAGLRGFGLVLEMGLAAMVGGAIFVVGLALMAVRAARRVGTLICAAAIGVALAAAAAWTLVSITR